MIKFKGIRQAIYGLNHYKHVMVYFDIDTREIWANEYTDGRTYTQYNDESIHWLNFEAVYMFDDDLSEKVDRHFYSGKNFNCKLLTEIVNKYIEYLEWWDEQVKQAVGEG